MKQIDYSLRYVVIPILAGIIIYTLKPQGAVFHFTRDYLPDGLWAFSLSSLMLIIWDGKISKLWTGILLFIFPAFEFLQSIKIINGIGDFRDVIFYYLFAIVAFVAYKQTFKTSTHDPIH